MRINDDTGLRIPAGTRIATPAEDPGRQPSRLPALTPDQQVKGEVFARLSDQVYLIRIAGEIYRTELPMPLRPGDQLLLTFRANEPRPSFTLQNPPPDAAPVKFSPTASWLSNVVTDTVNNRSASLLRPPAPLVNSPPADAATLATLLRNALTHSGLFYESHLLQWYLGERVLTDIMKEPQARLTARREQGKTIRDLDLPREETKTPARESLEPGALDGEPETPGVMKEMLDLAAPSAIPVIREQIAVLLSGMLRWQGEVWPGQDMEWDISRGDDGPEQEAGQSWQTCIRLDLPNLGSVNAHLTFTSGGIRAALKTDSPVTKELMEKECESLGRNMSKSGLRLLEMVVECETRG
ncbi:MAG: flagellar hook-length control protein FliK [Deltaproteobacteria bacterium]|nr:flagellar hook-length control protein FliK [Deltaproteobacteria bacterium]